MKQANCSPGISRLLRAPPVWLKQGRIGLVTHQAAVLRDGRSSAQAIYEHPDINLAAILGPEHGFFGAAGPGEKVRTRKHPEWAIPVHSLYGENRKPSRKVMNTLDGIIVDLCDLSARPYTYLSTLHLCLEAAAETGTPIAVADRPVPLPDTIDGPMVQPGWESFVATTSVPMVYGMTQAETAKWLVAAHSLDVSLHTASMRGYQRTHTPPGTSYPWIPPSPAIKNWETATLYTTTVCTEALPALDCDRHGPMPFQVLGCPWINGHELAEALNDRLPPSVRTFPYFYRSATHSRNVQGIRFSVLKPNTFKPVSTAIIVLSTIRDLYGSRLWTTKGSRPEFFDKLFGSNQTRLALMDGEDADSIIRSWQPAHKHYRRSRNKVLLYRS